ncbi:hypothetical protein [Pseudomonas sp. CF161]|nr:hypothetical protein [Pseudomonas sp. CF161]EPL08729.1 hypothetical protein CF161_14982 [Pseudomonas sp. CF161]
MSDACPIRDQFAAVLVLDAEAGLMPPARVAEEGVALCWTERVF